MYVYERSYVLATMAHLTISDSVYLGWIKIVVNSGTLGSFGRGSGIPCVLQEDALETVMQQSKPGAEDICAIVPQICAIPAGLPVQDLGDAGVGVSSTL